MEIRMSRIEGVIFDWAGTTVDFGCFAPVQAFVEAFKAEGIEPTIEEVRKPMGMLKRDHVKAMMSMPRIHELWKSIHGGDWTEEDVDRVYRKSEHGIIDIVHNFAEPKPYVLETVAELRNMGIKIGSTTGYTDAMMAVVVEEAKKAGYKPDCWFSPNAVNNMGRPYPYMIYKNMEALKLTSAANVIKVGDTVADITEGRNAGVITVGIVEGSSIMALSEEEFNKLSLEEYKELYKKVESVYWQAGADYVIPNTKHLIPLVEALG